MAWFHGCWASREKNTLNITCKAARSSEMFVGASYLIIIRSFILSLHQRAESFPWFRHNLRYYRVVTDPLICPWYLFGLTTLDGAVRDAAWYCGIGECRMVLVDLIIQLTSIDLTHVWLINRNWPIPVIVSTSLNNWRCGLSCVIEQTFIDGYHAESLGILRIYI